MAMTIRAMDVGEESKTKPLRKRSSYRISLSASLPEDVCGDFSGGTICAVKLSMDPFSDMRASVIEMIQNVGVHDWDEMEELVYCYIALNSPDLHDIIANAFLSLCCY
ncbi:unnamed protein product [Dovyalis caffra]|uniref:Transcription repressor n=1 Tax=Dovyalis caffra TaxID=77055 RepID=A0AAV1QU12_9ROSI|nr:unnamed protein product [Dovyalis caffra]